MADKEASLLIRIKQQGAETLDKINTKTLLLGASVAYLAKQLFDFGVKAFEAFAESEAATNKLNQALIQQGIYTTALSRSYQDLAGELQKKSLFSDEEIMSAQATMTAYLGQTKVSKELLKATLDLATAKKMDLSSAAEMVAKSIGTGTNALARQGVELDTTASKEAKLAAVVESLNGKFGGQAEAATKGAGALKVLGNTAGEVMEKIGAGLSPAIQGLTDWVRELVGAVDESNGFWASYQATMHGVSFTVIVLKGYIDALIYSLGAGMEGAIQVFHLAATGRFSEAAAMMGTTIKNMKANADAQFQEMNASLALLSERHTAILNKQYTREEDNLRASNERAKQIDKERAAAKEASWSEEEQKQLEHFLKLQADRDMASEQELSKLRIKIELEKNEQDMARLAELDAIIAFNESKEAVLAAHEERNLMLKKYYDAEDKKRSDKKYADDKAAADKKWKEDYARADATEKFEMIMNQKKVQRATQTMSDLARMQDSKSKELVAIGKAAAMAQIGIDTARAVMGIWGWAAAIPFVGPALAVGLSAAVIAYGAEQISRVNSAQMAEGGIVQARPGGMLATIGEGGRDEAVIPLEDGKIPGMQGGGGITLNVYGGLLGDEASAYELARALDRQLLKLQQSGDSVSSDRRV